MEGNTTTTPPRIDWYATPAVVRLAITCPSCNSDGGYDHVRSEKRRDGGRVRRCICRACREPFRIVEEFPGLGNLQLMQGESQVGSES